MMIKVTLVLGIACVLPLFGSASFADEKPVSRPKDGYKGKPAARMVYYTGKVQGVGFRDTARRIARDYPVTGWVKNLDDGRVQLLVEGPQDAVEDFLGAIRRHWKDNIQKEERQERAVSGKYKKFEVVF